MAERTRLSFHGEVQPCPWPSPLPPLPLHPSGTQGPARQSGPATFLGVLPWLLGCAGMYVETGAVPEVQAKLQGKGPEQSLAAALLCSPCPLVLSCCRLWGDGGHTAAWTCGS